MKLRHRRESNKPVAVALVSAMAFAGLSGAHAEENSLDAALGEFAARTGTQLVYRTEITKGLRARSVPGGLSDEDELKLLLKGTGLNVERINKHTLTIRRAADGKQGLRFPEVNTDVSGSDTALFRLAQAAGANDLGRIELDRQATESEQAPASASSSSPSFALEEIVVEGKRYGVEQTTVGRMAVPYIDTPQTTSIVTSDFLNDAKLFNTNDAVLFVPNVQMDTQINGSYYVRGVIASTSDDGTPAGSAMMDTFFYDRIEIAKGPASAAFGRGSPGGYINRVSKKARFREGTEANFLIGTGNDRKNTYRTTLENEGFLSQDHQTAYRFAALYDDGAQSSNTLGNYRRAGAQLAITKLLSDNRGQFDVLASYQHASNSSNSYLGWFHDPYLYSYLKYSIKATAGVTLPDIELIDGNNPPGLNSMVATTDVFRLQGTLDYRLSDHWRGRLAGAYVDHQVLGDSYTFYPVGAGDITPDGKDLQGYPYRFSISDVMMQKSAQVDLLGDYAIAPIGARLRLLTGADYNRLNTVGGFAQGFAIAANPMPLHSWDPNAKVPAYAVNPLEVGPRGRGDNWSVYAQGQLGFLQDRVRLAAAARRIYGRTTYLFQNNGAVLSIKTHSPLLPQYSLLLKPRNWLSLYVTHSEQLEPPALSARYSTTNFPTTDIPANDPIRTEQFVNQVSYKSDEVGIKTNLFDDRLTFSLSRFRLKSQGSLLSVPTSYTTPDGRQINVFRLQGSEEKIEGWEIEGFGKIGWRLAYALGASLGTEGEKTGVLNGSLIKGSSQRINDSVFGYATYRFGQDRDRGLSVTAGAKMVFSGWMMGAYSVFPKDPAVFYPKDNYVVDLGAAYTFSDKLEVFVKGNNVTHEEPVAYGGYTYLIPGRQIFAGITARL